MRHSLKLAAGLTALTMILASCSVGNYNPGGVGQVTQEIKWGRNQNPPAAKVAGMQGWVQNFRAQARAQQAGRQRRHHTGQPPPTPEPHHHSTTPTRKTTNRRTPTRRPKRTHPT